MGYFFLWASKALDYGIGVVLISLTGKHFPLLLNCNSTAPTVSYNMKLVDWDARGHQIKTKAFRGIWRLSVGNY